VIVAIGRKAALSLHDLDPGAHAVRHPANGGATLFREQLRDLAHERGLA
jgi:hypothetical protein